MIVFVYVIKDKSFFYGRYHRSDTFHVTPEEAHLAGELDAKSRFGKFRKISVLPIEINDDDAMKRGLVAPEELPPWKPGAEDPPVNPDSVMWAFLVVILTILIVVSDPKYSSTGVWVAITLGGIGAILKLKKYLER